MSGLLSGVEISTLSLPKGIFVTHCSFSRLDIIEGFYNSRGWRQFSLRLLKKRVVYRRLTLQNRLRR
jgi:hypothetical protein